MVCTGCCGTLDFIVTHLFKTLSKRRKKNASGMEEQPPCLRILESHPEMIQQVSCTLSDLPTNISLLLFVNDFFKYSFEGSFSSLMRFRLLSFSTLRQLKTIDNPFLYLRISTLSHLREFFRKSQFSIVYLKVKIKLYKKIVVRGFVHFTLKTVFCTKYSS